jgi:hypothetical protein
MSTQIGQLELPVRSVSGGTVQHAVSRDIVSPERPLGAARGIVNAVLIATPFWALFAFILYLLI